VQAQIAAANVAMQAYVANTQAIAESNKTTVAAYSAGVQGVSAANASIVQNYSMQIASRQQTLSTLTAQLTAFKSVAEAHLAGKEVYAKVKASDAAVEQGYMNSSVAVASQGFDMSMKSAQASIDTALAQLQMVAGSGTAIAYQEYK
jgi:molybdopterin-binding protein